MLALIALSLIASYWNNWPVDLSALYFAAHFYEIGAFDLVYAPGGEIFWDHAPAEWQALAAANGRPDALVPAFVYPPIWAKLLAPVTQHIGFVAFSNILLVLFVLSLVASITLSFAIGQLLVTEHSGSMPSLTVWCLISGFAIGFTSVGALSLQLLQPQIFVTFLLIFTLMLLLKGHNAWAGGVLALAAAIKLMPAMLVILLIMEKRWVTLATFALVGAMLGLGSILIVGWPLHVALLERISSLEAEILVTRLSIGVELVLHHLHQLLNGTATWQIDQPSMIDQPAWNVHLTRLFLVSGVVGIWRATRGTSTGRRLWTRFIGLYLLVVISSPLAWLHYLLLPTLLLPGILSLSRSRGVRAILIFLAAIMSFPVFMWLLDFSWAGYVQVYLHFGVAVVVMALLSSLAHQSTP